MRKVSFLGLKKTTGCATSASEQKKGHAEENQENRDRAIARWYQEGGEMFLAWAKEHYTLYSGEKLRWDEPFLEGFYRLIGEPLVRDVYIEKGSQMGYTESLIAFSAFFLAKLRLPLGFGFETFLKQRDMVSSRIQLSFSHCKAIQEITDNHLRIIGRKDTDTKDSITIGGVKATFFYAGTQKNTAESGITRQASSRLSSFSASAIIADEVELWDSGILDISRRRMDATLLPNEIMRAGSTPGHEGGLVDVAVKSSDYIFQWHVICPHCGERQAISAFGNLLKQKEVLEEGRLIIRYLDKGGRPLDWFYHDKDNPEDSSYIGCRFCEGELFRKAIQEGGYRCILHDVSMEDFFQERRKTQTVINKVALRLPKLGLNKFDPVLRIKELFVTDNPVDSIQQGLGLPFSLGAGKIQIEVLMECVGLSLPDKYKNKQPDLVVMGLDQGKYSNHVIICGFYFADSASKELKWKEGHKQILWWGHVDTFNELQPLIEQYKVLLVGMDSEPEWGLAAEYCYEHPPKGPTVIALDNFATNDSPTISVRGQQGGLISGVQKHGEYDLDYWTKYSSGMNTLGQVYLFDQVNLDKTQYKRNMKNIKSHSYKKVPCYSIDRTFWLDMVRDRLYLRHTHYPSHTKYDPKDKNNLLYQYLTSDRLTAQRRWIEQGPDHFFHADSFAEAAVFVSMFETGI